MLGTYHGECCSPPAGQGAEGEQEGPGGPRDTRRPHFFLLPDSISQEYCSLGTKPSIRGHWWDIQDPVQSERTKPWGWCETMLLPTCVIPCPAAIQVPFNLVYMVLGWASPTQFTPWVAGRGDSHCQGTSGMENKSNECSLLLGPSSEWQGRESSWALLPG